jgi:glycosyltransferase Alg8
MQPASKKLPRSQATQSAARSKPPRRDALAADRFRPTQAGWHASLVATLAYAGVLLLLVAYLPTDVFDSTSHIFILTIGVIGLWRYGWWFIHYVRCAIYRHLVFPRLRSAADAVSAQGHRPGHVYVLCTSYRTPAPVTYAVYEGLLRNAADYAVPTTIFAAVSDRTDVDVLAQLLDDYGHPANVEICYMFQRGDGKRSAMAEVLRAVSRRDPGPDDLVVFMDGDIRLPATTFRRSMPFFFLEDDLGALTTNNRAMVTGGDATKEWYDLRYAQRHMLMSSLSLSRRVLVLTGRYSVVRADLCTRPDFIELVERDQLAHRRFGTITFLSGDDKSTWYWLLKNNWAMRYLPDVMAYGFEELPDRRRFFSSTIDLMRRWFGNMFRTSGRAIALGPRGMGMFTWWCLVDQRLSIWTTLIGPTVAISLTLFVRPSFGLAYLLWIMVTRLLAALLLGIAWGRMSPLWPPLLYYNQVVGAALKSGINFRFNQQKWTRQGISSLEAADPRQALRIRRESAALHAASITALVAAVTFATGALGIPDHHTWQSMLAGEQSRSDDYWIAAALRHRTDDSPVLLPPEEIFASWRTFAAAGDATLRGSGADRTLLRLAGLPASTALRGGEQPADPAGPLRCGEGVRACRIGGGLTLSNLRLTTQPSQNTQAGVK